MSKFEELRLSGLFDRNLHWLGVYFAYYLLAPFVKLDHWGNIISPTGTVNGAGTVQSDCRLRITAFNQAITVNDTVVIACLS